MILTCRISEVNSDYYLQISSSDLDSFKMSGKVEILDWTGAGSKSEDFPQLSAIRLAVKKELRGKVPFSELDNLLKEVIEQAEGPYRDWPLEA